MLKRACFKLAGLEKETAMHIILMNRFKPGSDIEVAWKQGGEIKWWKSKVVGWDMENHLLEVRWPEENTFTKLNPTQYVGIKKKKKKKKPKHGDWRRPKKYKRRNVGSRERIGIAERQNFKCPLCGKRLNRNVSLDHIVPISVSGDNSSSNLQLVHNHCHTEKSRREYVITSKKRRRKN